MVVFRGERRNPKVLIQRIRNWVAELECMEKDELRVDESRPTETVDK